MSPDPLTLATDDRDLRSPSLTHLLRELGPEPAVRWQRQARVLDTLYAPTRYPDALGDDLPADVFGPEDAERALDVAIPKAAREGPTRHSIRTGSLITQSESA